MGRFIFKKGRHKMTELATLLVIAIFVAWGWAILKDDKADRKKELYRKAERAAEYRLRREEM